MKVTGILILIVGIAAALFTVVNAMSARPAEDSKVGTAAANPNPSVPPVVIPLVVAVAGIGIGGGLLVFGGKGYDRIQNPAVRN